MTRRIFIPWLSSLPLPYLQTWVHQPYLDAGIVNKTVKAFLDLVEPEAIQAAGLAEFLLPGGLLKAPQFAVLQIIDDSQVEFDGGLPMVNSCHRDFLKQGLGDLTYGYLDDQA